MAVFDYKKMAENIAHFALEEVLINDRSLKEWIKIISNVPDLCDDCISRAEVKKYWTKDENTTYIQEELFYLCPLLSPNQKPGIGREVDSEA